LPRKVERGETTANAAAVFARRANVRAISVGSMQMFEAMGRAIAASGIKPVLDKVFPFDEAQAAYRHMASGVHFGKIVIRVG
jgi:NADPH:quinone reductase-like Zn-dependent oxidoreductase